MFAASASNRRIPLPSSAHRRVRRLIERDGIIPVPYRAMWVQDQGSGDTPPHRELERFLRMSVPARAGKVAKEVRRSAPGDTPRRKQESGSQAALTGAIHEFGDSIVPGRATCL